MKNRILKFRQFCSTEDSVDFGMHHFELRHKSLPVYDGDWSEVMQFTGLKDKNNKEIYEGDIVERDGVIDHVVYNDMMGGFMLSNSVSVGFDASHTWEVIGTIYENPELLSIGEKDK